MNESVVNFGPGAGLVGVLTEPDERDPNAPTVVLLNAGIIHRIGPNRVHVDIGRTLGGVGIASLRFDLAGIGDSRSLGTTMSQDEECLASIGLALDLLESRGASPRFVLYGACSGAAYAFRYARRDPRVIGVAGVDPPTIERSGKSHALRLLRAARRPVVWYRFVTGRYGMTATLWSRLRRRYVARDTDRQQRSEAQAGFAEMVRRGAQLLLVITGAASDRYNYRSQLFDVFPGMGLEDVTKVTMLPYAGHTFARETDRTALGGELLQWLAQAPFPRGHDPDLANSASPSARSA